MIIYLLLVLEALVPVSWHSTHFIFLFPCSHISLDTAEEKLPFYISCLFLKTEGKTANSQPRACCDCHFKTQDSVV